MGEIIQEEKQKGGKRKAKRHSTHIDMTPMVDLMCLLITFFMLTTAFSKSKVMEIVLPEKIKKNENVEPPKIAESRTINIILGPANKVFWYPGRVKDAKNPPPLQETDFSDQGIRKLLLDRNKLLFKKVAAFREQTIKENPTMSRDSLLANIKRFNRADDSGPIVLIKAYKEARYANVVDIIDEMAICNIVRYAIVDINYVEDAMVETAMKGAAPSTTPQN
ncbi:MAG: ExbD/TolR family protein [Tenuifilaceae bacterium]